jgi:archaellum component FlaC
MTVKQLQTLVEQLAIHSNVLAEQQSIINKLLTEGIRQTGEQIQALLLISQQHKQRLDNLEGNQ